MSTDATATGIQCRGLLPAELDVVTRLGAAITQRFAAQGHAVRVCQAAGEGAARLLCFLTADGKNLGSVQAADLLEAPLETAAGLIISWVG